MESERTLPSPMPLTPQTVADDDSLVDSPLILTPPSLLPHELKPNDTSSPRTRPRASSHASRTPFTNGIASSPESRIWRPEVTSSIDSSPLHMRGMARITSNMSPARKDGPSGLPPVASSPPDEETKLHLLLNFSELPQSLSIRWDVRDVPSTSTVRMVVAGYGSGPVSVSNDYLLSPASSPPMQEMRINCVGHRIWDSIVIRASDNCDPQVAIQSYGRSRSGSTSSISFSPQSRTYPHSPGFVSVLQVLRALHDFFRKKIRHDEYDSLESLGIPNLKKEVVTSFYSRVHECERIMQRFGGSPGPSDGSASNQDRQSHQRSPSANDASGTSDGSRYRGNKVYSDGLRRVDFLMGQFLFRGLEEIGQGLYSAHLTRVYS